jgi:hypothetical protein
VEDWDEDDGIEFDRSEVELELPSADPVNVEAVDDVDEWAAEEPKLDPEPEAVAESEETMEVKLESLPVDLAEDVPVELDEACDEDEDEDDGPIEVELNELDDKLRPDGDMAVETEVELIYLEINPEEEEETRWPLVKLELEPERETAEDSTTEEEEAEETADEEEDENKEEEDD